MENKNLNNEKEKVIISTFNIIRFGEFGLNFLNEVEGSIKDTYFFAINNNIDLENFLVG